MTPRQNNATTCPLNPGEAAMLAKYRNASPAGKACLRRLALRYRNTHPAAPNTREQTP